MFGIIILTNKHNDNKDVTWIIHLAAGAGVA